MPASFDSVGFNGRQMKQSWTKYIELGKLDGNNDKVTVKSGLEPHIFIELLES